jgi:rhamnose utilization protein RhaD (predicted bifunctional aldolase and dehydrogenase)
MMNFKNSIKNYSTLLGNDSLLVQGAGGNISWKENNILWIKASGTWLAEANQHEIFIPLDLNKTRQLIEMQETNLSSACLSNTLLRPSIETSLHALLSQPIVIHIHAIEVLALAVRSNAKALFSERLAGLNWIWIDYVKPGLALTKKIAATLASKPTSPDIIILGNHGLVLTGTSIEAVHTLLQEVLRRCHNELRHIPSPSHNEALQKLSLAWQDTDYQLPSEHKLHTLVTDETNKIFSQQKWVMYPDHAIFLGSHAIFLNHKSPRDFVSDHISYPPACILVANQGVVVHKNVNRGQLAMMHCYLDVILRLSNPLEATSLSHEQIEELLHWDAEKYRQKINLI